MVYLLGPSLFIVMEPVSKICNKNRRIYMFGEIHFTKREECKADCRKNRCYNVVDVLTEIFDNSFINDKSLYFSIELCDNVKVNSTGYLGICEIYHTFCDEFSGNNQVYANIVFDRGDIRCIHNYHLFITYHYFVTSYYHSRFHNTQKYFIEFIEIFYKDNILFNLIITYMFSNNFIEDVINILSQYENHYMKIFFNDNIDKLEEIHEIELHGKSYSLTSLKFHILEEKNKYVYDRLRKFIMGKLFESNSLFLAQLMAAIELFKTNANENAIKEKMMTLGKIAIIIMALVLDANVLANYFNDECVNFDYVILYFGGAHIQNFFEFFKQLDFNILEYSTIKNNNRHCVEINDINSVVNFYTTSS